MVDRREYNREYYLKKKPDKIQIYIIECNITSDKYVGSTSNELHRRIARHISGKNLCSSSIIIDRNDFTYRLLEECDNAIRNEREQYWINELNCINIKNPIPLPRKEMCPIKKKNYDKYRREWKMSWGETKRDICNLLYIKTDLFC